MAAHSSRFHGNLCRAGKLSLCDCPVDDGLFHGGILDDDCRARARFCILFLSGIGRKDDREEVPSCLGSRTPAWIPGFRRLALDLADTRSAEVGLRFRTREPAHIRWWRVWSLIRLMKERRDVTPSTDMVHDQPLRTYLSRKSTSHRRSAVSTLDRLRVDTCLRAVPAGAAFGIDCRRNEGVRRFVYEESDRDMDFVPGVKQEGGREGVIVVYERY